MLPIQSGVDWAAHPMCFHTLQPFQENKLLLLPSILISNVNSGCSESNSRHSYRMIEFRPTYYPAKNPEFCCFEPDKHGRPIPGLIPHTAKIADTSAIPGRQCCEAALVCGTGIGARPGRCICLHHFRRLIPTSPAASCA